MNRFTRVFRLLSQRNVLNALVIRNPTWRISSNVLPVNSIGFVRSLTSLDTKHLLDYNSTDKNSRSIFFGGVKSQTTEEEIEEYFSSFGDVEDVRLMKTYLGYSLSYGFVCFKNVSVVDNVLSRSHQLNGKVIDVGRCKKVTRISVDGIPVYFDESDVGKYFSKFGEIISIRLNDPKLKTSIITFSSSEEAYKAVEQEQHMILNVPITVQLSEDSQQHQGIQKVIKKIFVKNLSLKTITAEKLAKYFSKFGKLERVTLFIDSYRRDCGAVVMFANPDSALKTLAQKNHEVDGRQVSLDGHADGSMDRNIKERSLYVHNLSPNTTEQSLYSYFNMYGGLLNATVLRDYGVSLRCGFIKFKDRKALNSFIDMTYHTIDGVLVTARRCTILFPKDDKQFSIDISEN